MSLEDEVMKLMDDAVKASPQVLALLTGETPPSKGLRAPLDVNLLADTMLGQRRAIQRIAREIDQARDTGSL